MISILGMVVCFTIKFSTLRFFLFMTDNTNVLVTNLKPQRRVQRPQW
mgnify:CR=1 FL=1